MFRISEDRLSNDDYSGNVPGNADSGGIPQNSRGVRTPDDNNNHNGPDDAFNASNGRIFQTSKIINAFAETIEDIDDKVADMDQAINRSEVKIRDIENAIDSINERDCHSEIKHDLWVEDMQTKMEEMKHDIEFLVSRLTAREKIA